MLGKVSEFVRAELQQGDRAFAEVQRCHHGVPHPLLVPLRRLELIHNQFDEMTLVAVQGIHFVQREDIPVHPDIGVATLAELVEQFAVVPLAADNKRSQEVALLPLIFIHYEVHDLRVGVADHFFSRDR